jgi:alkaline phosphatase D
MREKIPIIGVWDDHDFGADNSGREYKNKHIQKQMFLDFIDEPLVSHRRTNNIEGVYADYYVQNNGIKVHIILVDVRFNMIPEVDVLNDK